jgi:hypothetical protein
METTPRVIAASRTIPHRKLCHMATPSPVGSAVIPLPASMWAEAWGECLELLEVHISEDVEYPLTGINRGFGQLSDLATLALVDIERKEPL